LKKRLNMSTGIWVRNSSIILLRSCIFPNSFPRNWCLMYLKRKIQMDWYPDCNVAGKHNKIHKIENNHRSHGQCVASQCSYEWSDLPSVPDGFQQMFCKADQKFFFKNIYYWIYSLLKIDQLTQGLTNRKMSWSWLFLWQSSGWLMLAPYLSKTADLSVFIILQNYDSFFITILWNSILYWYSRSRSKSIIPSIVLCRNSFVNMCEIHHNKSF
jgi:hypothetical protein